MCILRDSRLWRLARAGPSRRLVPSYRAPMCRNADVGPAAATDTYSRDTPATQEARQSATTGRARRTPGTRATRERGRRRSRLHDCCLAHWCLRRRHDAVQNTCCLTRALAIHDGGSGQRVRSCYQARIRALRRRSCDAPCEHDRDSRPRLPSVEGASYGTARERTQWPRGVGSL